LGRPRGHQEGYLRRWRDLIYNTDAVGSGRSMAASLPFRATALHPIPISKEPRGKIPDWSTGTPAILQPSSRLHCTSEVSCGSRLCENPDVQLACRTSISISSMWESIVLATSLGRRRLRKQFCAFFAQARFHTAWVNLRPRAASALGPFNPRTADIAHLAKQSRYTAAKNGLLRRLRSSQ
jgi:hypothetical protein